jgi:hypothetical protein
MSVREIIRLAEIRSLSNSWRNVKVMGLRSLSKNDRQIFIPWQTKLGLIRLLHILVNMRVEEERVHTPREWLDPSIQKLESRRRREFATVLVLDVLDVGNVLSFRIVNPSNTNSDSRDANIEADFPPQVRGLSSVVGKGFVGFR